MKSKYKSILVVSTLSAVFALSGCSNAVYRTTPRVANNVNRTHTVSQTGRRVTNNAITGHGYGYSRATYNVNNNARRTVAEQRGTYSNYPVVDGAVSGRVHSPAPPQYNVARRDVRGNALTNSVARQGITRVDGTRNIGRNELTTAAQPAATAAPAVKKHNTAAKPAAKAVTAPKSSAAKTVAPKTTVAKNTTANRTAPISNNVAAVTPAPITRSAVTAPAPQRTAPRVANNVSRATRNSTTDRTEGVRNNRNRSIESTHTTNRNYNADRTSHNNRNYSVNRNDGTGRNFYNVNQNYNSTNRNFNNADQNFSNTTRSYNNANQNFSSTSRSYNNADRNFNGVNNINKSAITYDGTSSTNRNFNTVNRVDSYYNNDGFNNVVAPVSSIAALTASDIDVKTYDADTVIIIDHQGESDIDSVIIDNGELDEIINFDDKDDNVKNIIGNSINKADKNKLVPVTGNTIHKNDSKSALTPAKTSINGSIGNTNGNNATTDTNNPLIPNNNVNETNITNNGNATGNTNNGTTNNNNVNTENNVNNETPETNNTNNGLLTVENDTENGVNGIDEAPSQEAPQQAPKSGGFQRFFKKAK